MEYKGQRFEEVEPRLFDLRLGLLTVSLALMALGLLIRGERAFGLIAGRPYTANANISLVESIFMALGVSLATIVVLLFWDAKTKRSWEFAGLVVGAFLEGFNSFLSATMTTGGVTWLVSREATMIVLAGGSVTAWVIGGKLFAAAYSRHTKDYKAWYRRATAWRNALVAADTEEMTHQQRLAERRAERRARQMAQQPHQESVGDAVPSVTIEDWRKYTASLDATPTRQEAIAAMRAAGLPDTKAMRDKVGRWYRATYENEEEVDDDARLPW